MEISELVNSSENHHSILSIQVVNRSMSRLISWSMSRLTGSVVTCSRALVCYLLFLTQFHAICLLNQLEAPEYHEEDMKTPTSLFSGSNDKLACPTDVRLLKDRITNLKYFRERDLKRFKAGIMLTFYLEIMHLSFFTQSLLI